MGAPTPAVVDAKAADYNALKAALLKAFQACEEAQKPLEKLKEELVELVRDYGSTHAEKSKLLHGVSWEMMATFGQSVSIDTAAVERFRLALVKASQARLLKRVFDKDIRWTLRPDFGEIIKGEKLSKPLLALYSQCQDIKPSAPRLVVREKSA